MIYIFGHQNPDTDSVCSAIALSKLKNQQGHRTQAYSLGEISRETAYVLDRFNVEAPPVLEDIKTEVHDLEYEQVEPVGRSASILQAFRKMEEEQIKTLPVCDEQNRLRGILTMKDIAMGLIHGDERRLVTHVDHVVEDLGGRMLVGSPGPIDGRVMVMAFFHKTVKRDVALGSEWITIVGDNYENIALCIESGVQLVIVTGGHGIPATLVELAEKRGVPVVSVPLDTYMTSRKIDQCNHLSSIMRQDGIAALREYEYLEDVYKTIRKKRHTYYPVVGKKGLYLGFIGRNQLMNPQRKRVILVDHNEYSQSAPGIEEAEILEVVDHHKIGSIRTTSPIAFRNMPVGSTCTIVTQLYREADLVPDYPCAGLLLSGIISDTLHFKSPTTTEVDRSAAEWLNRILRLDLEEYAKEMFRVGTSLKGLSLEEVFYQDFKTFDFEEGTLGVSQVFTLDLDYLMEMKERILEYIGTVHKEKGYHTTLLVVTDILREGSTLFYLTPDDNLMGEAFGEEPRQGMFVPQVMSRKKQVVPSLLEAHGRLSAGV